jgi:putative toxin-antitoxin system antitoxin component (TIGR02293 family)
MEKDNKKAQKKKKLGNITYQTLEEKINDLVEAVRDGVSYNYFASIAKKTPFTLEEWSNFLHLSERTFQRYRKERRSFDPNHSEKILEIGMLYNKGLEVFGDKENFDTWLDTKSVALGGVTPKSFLDSSFGIQLIRDELTRVEHGVLA